MGDGCIKGSKRKVLERSRCQILWTVLLSFLILLELEIFGEVNNVKLTSGALDFRVGSPGRGRDFHVDLNDKTVLLKEYHLYIWGKIHTLHTFNGIDKGNIAKPANWFITHVWRITMDGIAIALILLCMSSG